MEPLPQLLVTGAIVCLMYGSSGSPAVEDIHEDDIKELVSKDLQMLEKDLAEELVRRAFQKGEEKLKQIKQQKQDYLARGIDKPYSELSEASRQIQRMKLQHPKAKDMEEESIRAVAAIKELERITDMSLKELENSKHISSAWRRLVCPKPNQFQCDFSSPFRTPDGSCNNVKNPEWGMSFVPQLRFLDPAYDDGKSTPRTKSVIKGETLPSAREVSNEIFSNTDAEPTLDKKASLMLMAWGQFLDHDISFTPSSGGEGGSGIDCCSDDKRGDCFPITIPENDTYFDTSCMNFVRSSPAVGSCVSSQREQVNQLTSFIDASNVYGSTLKVMESLRLLSKSDRGKLRTNPGNLPPSDDDPHAICDRKNSKSCMKTGDVRANVVPHLGANHVMFLREHNRIAEEIATLNPNWSDEEVFQETRKIIGAFIQHITYKEWLPTVLGRSAMTSYGLAVGKKISYSYDNTVNPNVRNAFAAAALRYGHSLVPRVEAYLLHDYLTFSDSNPIENTLLKPDFVTEDEGAYLPELIRWVASKPQMLADRKLEDGIRNKLFLDEKGHSFDLGAFNIQRGRDHGLPSYNEYREYCGLRKAENFDDLLLLTHRNKEKKLLEKTYKDVNDIDLYAGAISEKLAKGADVGPTFQCILAEQFKALKVGDRFWYENTGVTGFTDKQLKEIRKVTLAKIICNSFQLRLVPKKVMNNLKDVDDDGLENDLEDCESLTGPDISKWKEE